MTILSTNISIIWLIQGYYISSGVAERHNVKVKHNVPLHAGSDQCSPDPCRNGGICQPVDGSCIAYTCDCPGCYTGRLCETRKFDVINRKFDHLASFGRVTDAAGTKKETYNILLAVDSRRSFLNQLLIYFDGLYCLEN